MVDLSSNTVWPRALPSCLVCSIGTTARTCSSPAVGKDVGRLGFASEGSQPLAVEDMATAVRPAYRRLAQRRRPARRSEALPRPGLERATVRIAAETDARQRGLGIAETDEVGRQAAAEVPDPARGPEGLPRRAVLGGRPHVDGLLPSFVECPACGGNTALRSVWVAAWAVLRKAARVMSPMSHALFPIDLNGGAQRLLANAGGKGQHPRAGRTAHCTVCGKESPHLNCHHRRVDDMGRPRAGETCGGPTEMAGNARADARRRGELQTIELDTLLEDARIRLGLDRLPKQVKCVKTLNSRNQTPEPIEKGILRATTPSLSSVTERFATT